MVRVSSDILSRLQELLAALALPLNGRLPTERDLSEQLGVTRTELRKALEVLEDEGRIWRHVGRGTFIGARPVLNLEHVSYLSSITSPKDIIEARLSLEPQLARLAALNGIKADFAEIRVCNQRCRQARDWNVYEAWDNKFHHALAVAARNKLLVVLFETLNAVRRSPTWRNSRLGDYPKPDHPSFAEHDAILDAVSTRDAERAEASMRAHLTTIRNRMN